MLINETAFPVCPPQVFIFLGETFLSMNWAIVADILLVRTRLSSLQMLEHVQTTLTLEEGFLLKLQFERYVHNFCLKR